MLQTILVVLVFCWSGICGFKVNLSLHGLDITEHAFKWVPRTCTYTPGRAHYNSKAKAYVRIV